MNQTKKTILLAAILALVLAGATVSYQYLSAKYTPPSDAVVLPSPEQNKEETENKETAAPAESTLETVEPSETDSETADETDPPLEPAPDFTMENVAGEKVNLSDCIGKPVIINFWATWCSPCKSELPAFNTAYQNHGDDIHFLMVNLTDGVDETVEKVKKFVANNNYTFPLYFDTEANGAMTYSVYSIPLTIFIDAKGNLLGGHRGNCSLNIL